MSALRTRHSLEAVAAMWLLAVVAAPGLARADIETRRMDGDRVFVSRPDRKPGSRPLADSRGPMRVAAPGELERLIAEVSHRYDMDPGLITTVVSVESGFNHLAVSPKGARGLMQLMPTTARDYGVRDPHDARENLEGGVAYLRDLLERYDGDMKLALAAYNAGPEAVERAAGVPNYRETQDYLRRIETRYGQVPGPGTVSTAGVRRSPMSKGTIKAARDEDGNIVATNLGGSRVRIPRKPAGSTPPR